MAEGSIVTDEMRAKIGTIVGTSLSNKVEKGAIRRFVQAVEDSLLPLYFKSHFRVAA